MVEWSQYHPVTVCGAGSNPVRTALLLFFVSSLIHEGKKNACMVKWKTVTVVIGLLQKIIKIYEKVWLNPTV